VIAPARLLERESGAGHADVANVLNCLCEIAMQRADCKAAEAYAQRSLAIMRALRVQTTGPDIDRVHVQTLSTDGALIFTASMPQLTQFTRPSAPSTALRSFPSAANCTRIIGRGPGIRHSLHGDQ
jgi:hypothetical protein